MVVVVVAVIIDIVVGVLRSSPGQNPREHGVRRREGGDEGVVVSAAEVFSGRP